MTNQKQNQTTTTATTATKRERRLENFLTAARNSPPAANSRRRGKRARVCALVAAPSARDARAGLQGDGAREAEAEEANKVRRRRWANTDA